MVECKNLTVTVGKTDLIKDVSFTATEGSITVILGKNGSGKTTLLRAIAGNIPSKGNILVCGKSINNYSKKQFAKIMATMPQNLPKIPITVKSLVSYGRHPYTPLTGVLSVKDRVFIDKAIEHAQINDITDKRVDIISGGERRKAYFAMMLAQDSNVLLLDEPTANLDIPYQRYFLKMLKKCKEKGNTVICVLHDVNQALEIADRIITLEDSKLCFNTTPTEFTDMKIAENHFGMERIEYFNEDNIKKIIYK